MMDLLHSAIGEDMRQVDAVIRESLHSDVALIRNVAEHIIQGGGKRLRPALLLLSARACGAEQMSNAYLLAGVIEIIHTTSLLHDDVVDESDMRRGRKTANVVYSNAASILVGDFLYSRAFQMMVRTDNLRVMRILSEATNVIAEGEVLQLLNMHDPDVTESTYLDVVRYKTARLFEAAGTLGALVAGATVEQEKALAEYAHYLGIVFQLIDDMLDFSGEEETIGKCIGDDLAEGKPTLPLIYAMQYGTPEQTAVIRNAITHGERDNFNRILTVIRSTGAIERVRERAEYFADCAKNALNAFPDSNYKKTLVQLPPFAVKRTF